MKTYLKPGSSRGKIPSLPFYILLQLNGRLFAGEKHSSVLDWLNSLSPVRALIRQRWANQQISPQNVSAWYRRDYQSWLHQIHELVTAGYPGGGGKSVLAAGGMEALRVDDTQNEVELPTRRSSKVARLPSAVRHEVCRRMHDGHTQTEILTWLNAQPVVIDRMRMYFSGRPITPQNMSMWRRTGYQTYQRDLRTDLQ